MPAGRRLECWMLVVGALQLLLFLGEPEIHGPHEGRVAATAREMAAGGDWLLPHLNGQPRLQKPPLAYWLAAVVEKATGSSSSAGARLPAALCGILALAALMDLGRRWLGPEGGAACGMVWVGTLFVAGEYRKAMADPYLACSVIVAVRSWVAHLDASRDGARGRAALEMLVYGLAAGAGALAKGPAVLLNLATALVPYHIVSRRHVPSFRSFAVGAAILLAVALPWPVAVLATYPEALSVWASESMGQAAGLRSARPGWFYIPQLFYIALFWTPFLMEAAWALGVRGSSADRRRVLWPLAWIAGTVALFSLLSMKKNSYLLPAVPALALAAGAGLVQVMEKRPRRAQTVLLRTGSALAAIALPVLFGVVLKWEKEAEGIPVPLWVTALPAALLTFELSRSAVSAKSGPGRALGALALGLALIVHLMTAWLEPLREATRSPAPFAGAVLATVAGGRLHAVEGVDEALLFHLGRTVEIWRTPADIPPDFNGYALLRPGELEALVAPAEVLATDARESPEPARLRLARVGRRDHP